MTDENLDTTADADIELGEVREEQPETAARPDQNKHLKVVPVFEPSDGDLPVYVDLDTMRDMEEHAATDTRVELGGVLLGGQYQDEAGRSFVVVTDCLRAEHYEATKGSFKFTHDTWQQISRERDEFPADLQMVGWYHTHPDWGIFLSGMDLFICENFFNRPLDLALVIDPCGHDRGFFQWTTGANRTTRRTDGFFLFASRFREWELTQFAEWMEEQPMLSDTRFRPSAGGAAPVVNLANQPSVWLTVAVLGMLSLQFCLLAIITWRLLLPPDSSTEAANVSAQQQLDRIADAQIREIEFDAKVAMLDEIVRQGGTPDGLVASLTERSAQLATLENDLQAHRQLNHALNTNLSRAEKEITQFKRSEERLQTRLKSLRDKQAETKKAEGDEETPAGWAWPWMALATAAGLICGAGVVMAFARPQGSTEAPEE